MTPGDGVNMHLKVKLTIAHCKIKYREFYVLNRDNIRRNQQQFGFKENTNVFHKTCTSKYNIIQVIVEWKA